jgi:hypothetical protein
MLIFEVRENLEVEDECRVLQEKAKKQKVQAGKESQMDGSKAAD